MRDPCSGIALTLPGLHLPGLPGPKPPKRTGDRHLHPGSPPPAAAHQLELRSLPGGFLLSSRQGNASSGAGRASGRTTEPSVASYDGLSFKPQRSGFWRKKL